MKHVCISLHISPLLHECVEYVSFCQILRQTDALYSHVIQELQCGARTYLSVCMYVRMYVFTYIYAYYIHSSWVCGKKKKPITFIFNTLMQGRPLERGRYVCRFIFQIVSWLHI